MGHLHGNRARNLRTSLFLACIVVATLLAALPLDAQTYISAEAIPSEQIVGTANLAAIEGIGYANRALWTERLLDDCQMVQHVIFTLTANGAISTVIPGNTNYLVAAGGYEGVTDPSYVFTLKDSGPLAVSEADTYVLANIFGYALNQGGTAQFSLRYDPNNPYEFSNVYAIVTFEGNLTGEHAEDFFNYLGMIDANLWSGANAGFTQISLNGIGPNNSMLFLIGDVPTSEFIEGLFKAARTTPGLPLYPSAGMASPPWPPPAPLFPETIGPPLPTVRVISRPVNPSQKLLNRARELRQKHLEAVANLLRAIDKGNVEFYLKSQFTCP